MSPRILFTGDHRSRDRPGLRPLLDAMKGHDAGPFGRRNAAVHPEGTNRCLCDCRCPEAKAREVPSRPDGCWFRPVTHDEIRVRLAENAACDQGLP